LASGVNGYKADVGASWRYAIWEASWAASDQFIGFLVTPNPFTCDTQPCYGVTLGPPPLKLYGEPGKKMQNDTVFFGNTLKFPEGAFKTGVSGYHGGQFGHETTTAMKPTGYCPKYCYGVGSEIERRFTIFGSIFHFQAPPNPTAYTAVPDS
jgi:hypothetical protein